MAIVVRAKTIMCAVVLAVTGCDDVRGECFGADDEVAVRSAEYNGGWLNGGWLNGGWLNGGWLNGDMLNGGWLNGAKLYGPDGSNDYIQPLSLELHGNDKAKKVWLDGSRLTVLTMDGKTLTGTSLKKAKFEFEVQESSNKKNKVIRVRGITQLAANSDVWLYDLDYKNGGGGWQPLCTDAEGTPTEAILLGELWSGATGGRREPAVGAVTFACRGAALAKCVEMGYKPWASVDGTSLSDLHQACTRMVRADYCGLGEAHTVDGTQIHVLDQLGVQKLDPNIDFGVEAEWGPDGAVCLNPGNMRLGQAPLSCQLPTCGAAFASGGLIQSGKIIKP